MYIDYKRLRNITLLYITLPIIIFFIGWLKLHWAILFTIFYLFASFRVCKDEIDADLMILPKSALTGIIVIAVIWCLMAGQGGYFSQSEDFNYRNAIFRDMISLDWPIMYPQNNTAMVYYIGHWMVPALIGKIAMFVAGKNIGWILGNFTLFLWTTIGIILVTLLIIKAVRIKKTKTIIIVMIIFVFFSGLDIIGILFQSITNRRLIIVNHLEWWATLAQYSSISTCLFWIFNQALVPWLIILLYINKESIKNYAFLGFSCLLYAPLPFIGIIPYLIGKASLELVNAFKKKEVLLYFKQTFSVQNIIALFTIFPIMYLYYYSNSTINSAGVQMNNNSPWGLLKTMVVISLFVVLEFALYAIVIYYENKKNLDYYICVIMLFTILFLKIGNANDFTMRVSIPSLMMLMILVIKSLLQVEHKMLNNQKHPLKRYKTIILVVLLLLGAFTPATEFIRATSTVIEHGKFGIVADDIKTLSDQPIENISNFVTEDPSHKKFFIYFAK